MNTMTALLFSISVFIANSRGGVDGFAHPAGLAFGSSAKKGGGAPVLANPLGNSRPGVCQRDKFERPNPFSISSSRTAKQTTTTTQLGITVALPLHLATPRLSAAVLRIAESWAPTVGVLTST